MDTLVNFFRSIIWWLFPYNTRGEVFFRTLYHRIWSTRLFTNFLMKTSRASYSRWLKQQDRWLASKSNQASGTPELSFLLSIPKGEVDLAVATIQTIMDQGVSGWKLIINLEISTIEELNAPQFFEWVGNSAHITTILHPYHQLEQMLTVCQTDYLLCCTPGDLFSKYLVGVFQTRYQENSQGDIYFYDSDHSPEHEPFSRPFFKPDKYSPELHMSINYLAGAILRRKYAQSVLNYVNPEWNFEIQEWEMLLRICGISPEIVHIPKILVRRPRLHPANTSQAEAMLAGHLSRMELNSPQVTFTNQSFTLKWKSSLPRISIIIPTKNNYLMINNLLYSLFTLTEYPNYEVILVDNGSTDQQVLDYYTEITASKPVKVIQYPEPFNYSRANNLGASHSDAELLLFMNNDMRVISPEWLAELEQWAMLPDVGVVGTKLLRRDRTIQHAGIVIGLQGFVGHLHLNVPEDYFGLMGSLDWYRNFSAVTGACQMIRRELFYQLGEYDENFQLVFSDVEFCLVAIKNGYRVVYNPRAALLHFEGKSRGFNTPLKDILRGFETMEEWLYCDDPYFSPNLTYTPVPHCLPVPGQPNNRIKQIHSRRNKMESQKIT